MRLTLRLMRILGGRPFLTFAVVTFLVGGLLAAIELTSRHALKLFVEDQLRRTPWDIAVYQSGGVTLENVRELAETGVDIISVGWITHSAPQLDIALDFVS